MTTTTRDHELADALRATLISPNVADSNAEPANVVDAIDLSGRRIGGGLFAVAKAIGDLAAAVRETKGTDE
jgi:hypothetical protein